MRLRLRVRELDQVQALHVSMPDEDDPGVIIRAAPLPPPSKQPPPIDLQPRLAHRPPTQPPGPPSTLSADAQEQRLAQLAEELAQARAGVAEREQAMDELRAEIARLRDG